jgi:RND family efflux transporter MFP subunit
MLFHSSRPRVVSWLLFLLVLALPLGCSRTAPPPDEKIPPAPVKWEGARQVVLEEWTELVGTTQQLPDHSARVTAPVEGRVLSVLTSAAGKAIVEGQMVQAGDVLARLDDTTLRILRDKADSAKKVLKAEEEIAALAVKVAALDVKRLKDLKAQQDQVVPQVELEKAQLALDTAEAHVRAGQRKLEAADEEVAALDRQLKLYTLTAPRKGRIGRLQVVVGQTLAIGSLVAEVVDIEDQIDVLAFVPASDVRKLKLGQPAHVGPIQKNPSEETGPDPEGKVEFIADQAETETGHYAIKVRFPNRDLKLRANAVVRLRVLTKPGKVCWALPEAAVMEDQDPPGIVIVEESKKMNADNKEEDVFTARRLRATLGVRDRVLRQVEIVRLEDPDKKWHGDLETIQVIVEKGQGLQTGDAVRLEVEDDEAPPVP